MITTSDTVKFAEGIFGRAQVYTKNIDVKCPFCDDTKKKRLSIRLTDHVCHCWVCGFGSRTLLPLVIKFGTKDEVQEYKTKFIPEFALTEAGRHCLQLTVGEEQLKRINLPSDFRLLTTACDSRDPDTRMLIKYCEHRGLTEREFWYWRLGYSNVGNLRRRVVVPSFDESGETNYFVARTIGPAGTYGKYANADLNKNEIVFNELNIDWTKKLVLVEGPFDLMKCRMNATCLLGSSLSPKSLLFQKILEHETPVILMLDDEMQGKAQQLGKFLQSFNIQVSVVKFNSGHDPGEMTFDQVSEYVEKAKPWTWNNFLSHKLSAAMSCRLKL